MSAKQTEDENKKQPIEKAASEAEKTKQKPASNSTATNQKKSNSAPSSPASSNTKKTRNTKLWLVLFVLFLLVLVAFAATAALGWFGYQQLIQLEQQLADRPTKQALQKPLQGLASINDLQERQVYLQRSFENQEGHLADIQQSLAKSSEPKPRDWLLAEVEYLLRLANQRLKLEEDVEGALTLMTTAEQRLKQAEVPGTLGVRSDLLEDIEELQGIPKLDKVSMALSLQKLADHALSLEVQPLAEAPSLSLAKAKQVADEARWYQHLWQEIKNLVVVRKRELPLEALPFTADELELRHQLSALLLQASWAALRGEQQLYDASISAAVKRFKGFDASQPAAKAFNTQLQALVAQKVTQKLPETETSLDSLQAFIAQRYSLKLPLLPEESSSEETEKEVQP
ncbi:uroporphyrinogen-III C-methyltransferase [Marinospirillum insulare]|uniref:Uroporphyrin-3 C-methyltransferase n=1 Tax=Marinospirillum insulare TaxID=217169 RepID=A0ABQ5ZXB5_9GAMM|nr:uroporphyrinogen-III C-methyltransferase [Marinospirillum insulare]GLR64824.1 hypothetical protein GCM10007878_22620 [Marinospirillum insulare]